MKYHISATVYIGIVVAAVLIASAAVYQLGRDTDQPGSSGLLVSQAAIDSLPRQSPAVPTLRLAKGLLPPTNKWFSSLVFSDKNQPVYAYPLSYAGSANGFSIATPPVVSSSNAIFGTHQPDIKVGLGSSNSIVQDYDDLSVVVGHRNADGSTLALTRITQGSPFGFTSLEQQSEVAVESTGNYEKRSNNSYIFTIGNRHYGLYTSATIDAQGQRLLIDGKRGTLITIFSMPLGSDKNAYFEAASRPILATGVSYRTTANTIETSYHLRTARGSSLFAATPDMNISGQPIPGVYQTLLGSQKVYSGNVFSDKQAVTALPAGDLSLDKLTPAQRADLLQKLQSDAASLQFTQIDSYFGGKELYRAANLLQIAESLHQTDIAAAIKAQLSQRLATWLEPGGGLQRKQLAFYYDPVYRGVVGLQASYGSENFNDHHFHYGYFIYAAAILGKYDQKFVAQHGGMVNALISDIASNQSSKQLPKLRVFDAYAGHSWASGSGDFADGNNQESSSEAVNAWYGVYLWSQVTRNDRLAQQSRWMYALESRSARKQWLAPVAVTSTGPAYSHPTVGIVWGGKIDYSTFFSPRPQAVLGIQLIPMSPAQAYLARSDINTNLASVTTPGGDTVGQFNDYLIMYRALSDYPGATAAANRMPTQDLDNGNSMTYMYAWLYSHAP